MRRGWWLPAVFAALACLLSGWMLIGIRLTNHDDIYFDIVAMNSDVGLLQAGWWVATTFGRRVSHLLNVPAAMLTLRIMDRGTLGDVALLGQLVILFGGTGLLLRRLVGGAAACGWAMCVAGGFALHWYLQPPLAYPLHGLNSLMLLVLSLLALLRHIERSGNGWLVLSVACSTPGFIWPEYNSLLFPLATLTLIALMRRSWRDRLRLALPFLLVWALCVLSFLLFRAALTPAQDEARMSLSFDPAAWAHTFGTLLGKGLLPWAMWPGIILITPPASPILPPLPQLLDATLLWRIMTAAPLGFGMLLLFWTVGFLSVFRTLAPRRAGLWLLVAGGVILMLVPLGVTSLSAMYQYFIRVGFFQGAMATVHAQAGFLTLIFAAAALPALRWRSWPLHAGLAMALAALCTSAMAYNLVNRDGMSANQQRWLAFASLAEALPDGTHLHAPSFWLNAVVVAIPGDLSFGMGNYWTERARLAHGRDIIVRDRATELQPGDVRGSFGARPDGLPVVLLRDAGRAWLIAARPRPLDPVLTSGAEWQCAQLCRLDLPADPDAAAEERLLRGPPQPRPGFLRWLTLPRIGAYGWR